MPLLMTQLNRRGAPAFGTGVLVSVGGIIISAEAAAQTKKKQEPGQPEEEKGEGGKGGEGGEGVSATEDLMREHGILRRTLIVYAELSSRLHANAGQIDPAALADAAKLFREFGEDYYEHTLEEQYVFPEVCCAGGPNEKLVEVLLTQHQRGREITDYLARVGTRGQIGGDAEPLANALASMARMYHPHSAWEDTVIFPAWKKT